MCLKIKKKLFETLHSRFGAKSRDFRSYGYELPLSEVHAGLKLPNFKIKMGA